MKQDKEMRRCEGSGSCKQSVREQQAITPCSDECDEHECDEGEQTML